MRKLRIFEHISLDGVIQHSKDDGDFPYSDWTAPYRNPAGAQAVIESQGPRYDLLLGRRTYDIWSNHWPKVKGGPFADAINAATKWGVANACSPSASAGASSRSSARRPFRRACLSTRTGTSAGCDAARD